MIRTMDKEFTVSEIARRVAPASDEAAVARVTRQLRHWTLNRIIEPVAGLHTGAGRHRRYSGDAVYLAAVMIELSRCGLPVGALILIGAGLKIAVFNPPKIGFGRKPLPKSQNPEKWRRAIEGGPQVFLTCSVHFDGAREGDAQVASIALFDEDEDANPIISQHASAIVVNLTMLFAKLRA